VIDSYQKLSNLHVGIEFIGMAKFFNRNLHLICLRHRFNAKWSLESRNWELHSTCYSAHNPTRDSRQWQKRNHQALAGWIFEDCPTFPSIDSYQILMNSLVQGMIIDIQGKHFCSTSCPLWCHGEANSAKPLKQIDACSQESSGSWLDPLHWVTRHQRCWLKQVEQRGASNWAISSTTSAGASKGSTAPSWALFSCGWFKQGLLHL
jgi:hypothetical protein